MARILLIEDNNDIQEILYSLLSEDHEVLQAFFSGTEGLRLFQQALLVLLDIMLPGKKWGPGPEGDPFAQSDTGYHDDRSGRQTPH